METNNTVVEQETVNATEEQHERTFTQAELDDIVKSRLAKERAKYADYEQMQEKATKYDAMEEANKTELQKATERAEALQKQIEEMTKAAEVQQIRTKISGEMGIPISLLSADTEEECKAQADAILKFAKGSANYPSVKDGGEIAIPSSNKSNGQLFGDWLSEQITR